MPKSKKNKIVHLTQVKKKGKDHKGDLVEQLKTNVKQYDYVYLFDIDATKSDRIMNLRLKMKQHGCVFAGRNSLVSLAMNAIGSKTRTSYKRFLKHITGHRALLFTNIPSDKLIEMLEANLQEFRDKLLGYAQLKANDAAADDSAGSGGEDESEEEDEEEGEEGDAKSKGKSKKSKKPMRYIRFRPIKRAKKRRSKVPRKDADGDEILPDANEVDLED